MLATLAGVVLDSAHALALLTPIEAFAAAGVATFAASGLLFIRWLAGAAPIEPAKTPTKSRPITPVYHEAA